MRRSVSRVQSYIEAWSRRGHAASEGDLYDIFARHIVCGLLGYGSDEYNITPRRQRGTGVPDLRLRAGDGTRWVAVEAKTDDAQIRSDSARSRLWREKRKYVDDETVYFVWAAPRTVLVCAADGKPLAGVSLEPGQGRLEMDEQDSVWITSTDDAEVAAHLERISARAARESAHLQLFREGKLPDRYIEVTRETVGGFTEGLRECAEMLLAYLESNWRSLQNRLREYESEKAEYDRELNMGVANPDTRARGFRQLNRKYATPLKLVEAFAEFRSEQSYTRFDREPGETEDRALERIFRANAAYVAMGRLLFVRLAEDHGLVTPKISNGGIECWNRLVGHADLVVEWVGVAFADARRVCHELFRETPFDALLVRDDGAFDQVLLRILMRLNAYDLSGLRGDVDTLGSIYQGILPRKLRKQLGEFYTDPEVVEYILQRVGFLAAVRGGKDAAVLDPACGSGAFLVRATGILKQHYLSRNVDHAIVRDRLISSVHGLDINHFAVYIADMNLLFATFDLTSEAGHSLDFAVYRINSLTRQDGGLALRDKVTPEEASRAEGGPAVRDGEYDFVVGNPPYVRAERLPDLDRAELRRMYPDLSAAEAARNVDLAMYFLRRALEWLKPGGRLGLILPRAIADAAYASTIRRLLSSGDYTVDELVPLDWTARELFDSDVVPFLLFVSKRKRPRKHAVRLVQRIATKAGLLAAARGNNSSNGAHRSEIPWADFQALSETGWPLEVTEEDVPLLRRLQGMPRLAAIADTRFGIKAGSRQSVRELRAGRDLPDGWQPMITGAEVHSFHVEQPRRAVLVSGSADPSVWARKPLPDSVVAVAKIHVTLNAAALDPAHVCAQDNVVLVVPRPGRPGALALAAVVNSRVARYFSFLLLRGGVAGGGRRDYTIYPRTLDALPVPPEDSEAWPRLEELGREARRLGALGAQEDGEVWSAVTARIPTSRAFADWPIDFTNWPESVTIKDYPQASGANGPLAEDGLAVAPGAYLRAAPHLGEYIDAVLRVRIAAGIEITRSDFQRMRVHAPEEAGQAVALFRELLDRRTQARTGYLATAGAIDQCIEEALGLSPEDRGLLARRMSEFPLNENANRPRLPWERTVKPARREWEEGARYHEAE